MPLTPEQQQAADLCLSVLTGQHRHRQSALLGYAGSGKTYTTQHIARTLTDAGYSVLALTHTHKALSVLSKSLPPKVNCATIFSALGWIHDEKRGGIRRTGRHKMHGYHAVIVDEASMVDAGMYDEITQRTEGDRVPVMWVGDPAQLPPVGYDSSPVFDLVQTQARLNEIVRQAEGSPIIQASMYLRECLERGTTPEIARIADMATDDRLSVISGGVSVIAEYMIDARDAGLDARAITYHRRQEQLIGNITAAKFHPPGSPRLVAGDPVTLSARYGEALNNGTEMTITAAGPMLENHGPLDLTCQKATARVDGTRSEFDLIVPQDSDAFASALRRVRRKRDYERRRARTLVDSSDRRNADLAATDAGILASEVVQQYAQLRYTYASTAHKSQGSTYDVAIVHWPDILSAGGEMACRLLYVACTRPSRYLVVVC